MSGIKKFFQSIDLRNNKILNAKVETPTETQHIANKEFVESQQKYDTTKAQTYNNPFKFDWITNVYNKTFKQILDDLFFPRVLPTFTNPEFTIQNFYLYDYPNYNNGKFIIFDKQSITFTLIIKLTTNDRLPLDLPILKVYNNTSIQTYAATQIVDDLIYFENISFIVNKSNLQFKVIQNFDIAAPKLDSYNAPYLETGFELPYLLEKDFKSDIENSIVMVDSYLCRNQTIENLPDGWYSDIVVGNPIPEDFSRTKKLYVSEGQLALFDLLIPTNNLPNNYYLTADIYDNSGTTPKLIQEIWLNHLLINNWDINLIYEWYEEYLYYQLNLGYFSTDIMIVLKINYNSFGIIK